MLRVDESFINLNLSKTNSVIDRLRALGYDDPELLGELGADLGDVYAESSRFQGLLDALLTIPTTDRERIGDILADLHIGMVHLRDHLATGVQLVERMAEDFD